MAKGNNGEGHASSNGANDVREALQKSTRIDRGQMTRAAREAAKERFLKHSPAEQEIIMRDWEDHAETKESLAEAQAEIERLKEQIEDQAAELQEHSDQIAKLIPFKDNKSDAIERAAKIRAAEMVKEAIAEHDKKKSGTYKRRTTSLKDREQKAKVAEEAAKAAEALAQKKLDEVENLGQLRTKAERLDKLEDELKATTAQLEEAKRGLTNKEIELAGYEQTKEDLSDLQKTYDQLTADHKDLKQEKQDLETEVDNAMASVNEETARELTELREQVSKLTAELETTVREKGDKHLELNKAKDEIQRLTSFETEAKALNEKLTALRSEVEQLNSKVTTKETERAESEAKVTQLTIDLKDCQRKYRLLRASYKSLEQNNEARSQDIEVLREQLGS